MLIANTRILHAYSVPRDEGDYLAAGNTASCSAQGFLESFFYGLSVSMNAILAFTYCMIVKLGREARSKRDLFMVRSMCASQYSYLLQAGTSDIPHTSLSIHTVPFNNTSDIVASTNLLFLDGT